MRNISSDMIDEYSDGRVNPVIMAELAFASQSVYLHTGLGDIEWNGNVFFGGAGIVGISAIEETQDLQANGIVATLNGISPTWVAVALSEAKEVRNRPFRLWIASTTSKKSIATEDSPGIIKTEDGYNILLENQFVDSPYRIFSGLMDVMEFTDNANDSVNIRMSVENSLIIGQRAKISRYTDEEQRRISPTDKGLEFINQLQDKDIVW